MNARIVKTNLFNADITLRLLNKLRRPNCNQHYTIYTFISVEESQGLVRYNHPCWSVLVRILQLGSAFSLSVTEPLTPKLLKFRCS